MSRLASLGRYRSAPNLTLIALTVTTASQVCATEQQTEIETIVVTATANDHQLNTAPASISIITAEEVRQLPIKDIGDVLRKNAGVTVYPLPGGRNSIFIRGLDENYVLMLVNGKRVSSNNGLWRFGNFDITSIPLESIERIEVVRGPMSALYGSDAVGGVVNIITRKPTEAWQTSFDAEYSRMQDGEGGDRYRTHLFSSGKISPSIGAVLSLEVADQDLWLNRDVTPAWDTIEGRETQKVSGTISWQIDERQVLDFDYANNRDDIPPTNYTDFGPEDAIREQTLDRHTFGIQYTGYWDWGSTKLLANREVSDIFDFNTRYAIQPPLGRDIKETNTTLRATAAFDSGSQAFTLGSEYLHTEVEDPVQYPGAGSESVKLISAFAQDEVAISNSFSTTVGVRFDDNDTFGTHWSPRIYWVYHPDSIWTVKGGVGTAFRAPTLFESSPTFMSVSCGGRCNIIGNKNLEPETSLNTELAVLMDANNWSASITAFRNEVENMITVEAWDRVSPLRTYYNEDEVTIKGLELTGLSRLTDNVTLEASYTYLETENSQGEELFFRPDSAAHLSVNWQVTGKLHTFIGVNYFGTHLNSRRIKQDAYTKVDLGGSYEFNHAIKVRAGITNVGDEQPILDDPASETILQGRAVFVGLNVSF